MFTTIKISLLNELEKMIAKRGLKIYFSLILLLPFLILFLAVKLPANDMLVIPVSSLAFSMLKGFVIVVLPLFSFIISADVFTVEQERGTLFSVRPIERIELYTSKILALCSLVALQLLFFYFATSLGLILFGREIEAGEVNSLFISTMISWFPLIAIILLAACIAQILKSSAATVGIGIFIYMTMFVLSIALPSSFYLFPTAYLDWYQIWNQNVSVQWKVQSSVYLFSFSSLFFASGYYMFKKKEA